MTPQDYSSIFLLLTEVGLIVAFTTQKRSHDKFKASAENLIESQNKIIKEYQKRLEEKNRSNGFLEFAKNAMSAMLKDAGVPFGDFTQEPKSLEDQLRDAIDREDYPEAERIQKLINRRNG